MTKINRESECLYLSENPLKSTSTQQHACALCHALAGAGFAAFLCPAARASLEGGPAGGLGTLRGEKATGTPRMGPAPTRKFFRRVAKILDGTLIRPFLSPQATPGDSFVWLIESAPIGGMPVYLWRLPRPGGIPGGCVSDVHQAIRFDTEAEAQAVIDKYLPHLQFIAAEHGFHGG